MPMRAEWVPEERPVPAELTDDYQHAVYPPAPVHFAPVVEQLHNASHAQLMELAGHAAIGEPDAHTR